MPAIFAFLTIVSLLSSISATSVDSESGDFFRLVQDLRLSIKGHVFFRGSPEYETARSVHNGACRNIFPLLIVKPLTTEDVASAVRFAIHYGIEISVRGGGHSYQCLGTKTGSLHIDMRPLNKVHFYQYKNLVKIGGGASWKHVIDVVDPKKYTFIHGNARNVGVGGYLLGVGLNPIGTSHRHGFGADHVIRYKAVLADGSIALVNNASTTIIQRNGQSVHEVYSHDSVPNLRYALRGAGPSFAIVTEFLYKVYPHPETLSCILPVYIESGKDLEKLVKAGQDGRYGITGMQPMLYRRPKPANWLAWMLIKAPQIMKWQSGKRFEPLILSVVDLNSNSGKTPAGPAIAFLKSYGLELAVDNPALIEKFGLDQINLSAEDQDSVYLTPDELKREGWHGMASANAIGLQSYKMIEEFILYHPVYGLHSRKTPLPGQKYDCDFCLWILYIGKPGVNDDVIPETNVGPLSFELACTYNAGHKGRAQRCPRAMNWVQGKMLDNARKYGETPRQYVNTPGCHKKQHLPFGQRYWGNTYTKLLKIKKFWDPNNTFNYCHSVGSDKEDCCAAQ